MQVEQRKWTEASGWTVIREDSTCVNAQLVLFFGGREEIADGTVSAALRRIYPHANVVGCSTAGEICGVSVTDATVVAVAMRFEHSRCKVSVHPLHRAEDSAAVGAQVGRELRGDDLALVFVLSSGINVNGSALVEGLRETLPESVPVTGGLAGDGTAFKATIVCCGDEVLDGAVVAVGLYSQALRIGYGSVGGWDPFGPERLVTRASHNVLYELDGNCALDLYRTYLGSHAAALPASGLLFPLSLRDNQGGPAVVRTILGIDESAGSLIFAGDIPQGSRVRLMRASLDRLIDGAHNAADKAIDPMVGSAPDLALLVSCVGRRLVLDQRVEEEVEVVRDVCGPGTVLAGFYSYGEIAPFSPFTKCQLHNQTMTITTLSER